MSRHVSHAGAMIDAGPTKVSWHISRPVYLQAFSQIPFLLLIHQRTQIRFIHWRLVTRRSVAIVIVCVACYQEIKYQGLTHVNRFFKQPTYWLFDILLCNKQIKRSNATLAAMFKQPNHPLCIVIILNNICFPTNRTSYSLLFKEIICCPFGNKIATLDACALYLGRYLARCFNWNICYYMSWSTDENKYKRIVLIRQASFIIC